MRPSPLHEALAVEILFIFYCILCYSVCAIPSWLNENGEENQMNQADRIRQYARVRYVLSARTRGDRRFSIPVREPIHALNMGRSAPAVCSALRTRKFLKDNSLRLVETAAPKSGQSTTVVYTYEFVDEKPPLPGGKEDAWARLRGAFKDIFAELGGGEAYLRAERSSFYAPEKSK